MDFIEQKEAQFYDDWARTRTLPKFLSMKLESISSPQNRQIVYLSKIGGIVTATDISPEIFEIACRLARQFIELQLLARVSDEENIYRSTDYSNLG